jgi:predicted porin
MKKILAIAIASAFAAPAFAATSNVDVYGVMNIGVFSVNSDRAGDDRSTSVSSQSSRIGFKGSEDVGGGLSAIWQIESSLNAEEGSGTWAGRNTFVGLKGGFGTVLLGKHDSPMKMLGRKVDNFGDTYADSRNLLGAVATTGGSAFDLRPDNVIAYVSPNFSGLTVTAAYVTDHGVNGALATFPACSSVVKSGTTATGLDCNDRDAYSLSGDYTNGPLMLGLGYERQNTLATAGNLSVDRSMWRLVGGYSFGDLKLGAQYERGSADTQLAVADRNGWGLFANYAMGNIVLKANYLSVGDYKGVNDSGANQYTLGADYNLSKRTTAYAQYAKIKNDTNAAFDIGRAQGITDMTNTLNGNDPSVFGVGIRHAF